MYHYTDGGLRNIWLANGYEQMETPYGMAITIQDLPGLSRAICKALIRKKSKVPKFADQMLRVFYAAHADGNEQVKNSIHALNDVERTIHFVMTETKQGWQSKISEVDLSERDEFEKVVNIGQDKIISDLKSITTLQIEAGVPRLLFKGRTSLSKAFGLISRFSEDIDITVFRDDLGQSADVSELFKITK